MYECVFYIGKAYYKEKKNKNFNFLRWRCSSLLVIKCVLDLGSKLSSHTELYKSVRQVVLYQSFSRSQMDRHKNINLVLSQIESRQVLATECQPEEHDKWPQTQGGQNKSKYTQELKIPVDLKRFGNRFTVTVFSQTQIRDKNCYALR